MKRLLTASCAALALFCAVPALAQAPASGSVAASTVQVPPLNARHRTLPNGLKIYTVRDTTTANVTVQVFYGVGSKDDPQGRSGFAHLFEHMMFKATRNLPSESFDRLTEDVGGFNNASTWDDYTNYYQVVPANHLERILFAEADRMGSLVVDEAVFKSERDVVKEELRQRVLASPYGRLFYMLLPSTGYVEHPYRRPGIGSIADLDAATIDDVRRFHATYYRPDNASLIVVGNFDQAQLDHWIGQYFTPIRKPAQPMPVNDVKEPRRTGPRVITSYAPNVPLPAVLFSWPAPRYNDPDTAALTVLDGILTTGEASRLYRALVYDKQVAAQVLSSADGQQQAGLFYAGAILAGGKTVAEGEAALGAEIARLRDQLVTADELAEAKNELIANALRSRESIDGRADAIGLALIMTGDARDADTAIAKLQAVTAEDVRRVARKYLADDQRTTVRYLNESERPPGEPARDIEVATAAPVTVDALAPVGQLVTLAEPAQRAAIPAVGPEAAVATPAVAERRLPNGLRVLVAPTQGAPLVSARLDFGAGSAADPAGKSGVAGLTASLVTQGTRTKTAPQIAQAGEAIGAVIGGFSGYDSSTLYANAPADVFPKAAALMAEVAREPTFADEELERQRAQLLDNLKVTLSQPGSIAGEVTGRVIYGDAPYGAPTSGTPDSLPGITRADLVAFHQARWRPSNATLTFTGAITPEQAFQTAQQLFGDWRDPAGAVPAVADPAGAASAPRVVVVDLPGTGQAAVTWAMRAIPRRDDAYYPLLLGTNVLGGGYSSRMNQEIRIKRGLSYGAFAGLSARRAEGVLTASTQTKNESAVEVVDLVLAELSRLAVEPIPAAELDPRRAVLIGGFGRSLETVDGLGGLIATYALHGLPMSELADYVPKVRGVTAEQIQAAVAREVPAASASLVVVGDAKIFLPALRAKHRNLEVISITDLDLDAAALK